mgnify:CR=1 FL=1
MEEEIIKNITAGTISADHEEITADASFRDDLLMYTSDIQSVVLGVEEEFDVKFPDGEIDQIDSVRDILQLLSAL